MKNILSIILVSFFGLSAFAETETFLKVPILVRDTQTDKVIPAAHVKFLNLPDAVIINRKSNPSAILEQLDKKITNARYEIEKYSSIGEYTDATKIETKLLLCYVGNPTNAVEILGGMADAFLSDQTQLNFYRIAGEANFRNTNERGQFVLPGTEEYSWIKDQLKINLKPGQILTLTAYTDDGDDQNADIISQCK